MTLKDYTGVNCAGCKWNMDVEGWRDMHCHNEKIRAADGECVSVRQYVEKGYREESAKHPQMCSGISRPSWCPCKPPRKPRRKSAGRQERLI